MRDNTQIRRSTNRNPPRQNSSNSKAQSKESSPPNVGTGEAPTSSTKATEEAIDVLSFVGFKL